MGKECGQRQWHWGGCPSTTLGWELLVSGGRIEKVWGAQVSPHHPGAAHPGLPIPVPSIAAQQVSQPSPALLLPLWEGQLGTVPAQGLSQPSPNLVLPPSASDSALPAPAPSLPAAAGGISRDQDPEAALTLQLSQTGTGGNWLGTGSCWVFESVGSLRMSSRDRPRSGASNSLLSH